MSRHLINRNPRTGQNLKILVGGKPVIGKVKTSIQRSHRTMLSTADEYCDVLVNGKKYLCKLYNGNWIAKNP